MPASVKQVPFVPLALKIVRLC